MPPAFYASPSSSSSVWDILPCEKENQDFGVIESENEPAETAL